MSSIPRSVSFLGEVSGNHLQYSCLGTPMDRGPWRTTKHDVAELYITEQLNNSNKMYYMHIYCIWPCICMLLWKLLTTTTKKCPQCFHFLEISYLIFKRERFTLLSSYLLSFSIDYIHISISLMSYFICL